MQSEISNVEGGGSGVVGLLIFRLLKSIIVLLSSIYSCLSHSLLGESEPETFFFPLKKIIHQLGTTLTLDILKT